jgi:Zn-finger nucleic acid-binding protein
MDMKCPVDGSALITTKKHGIEVEFCPKCEGMWLDYTELDALEDEEFAKDLDKGTMIFSSQNSLYKCPICVLQMKQFKYRLYDLVLDHCPDLHGFWLDGGEDKRVLDLMDRREKDIKRKLSTEHKWKGTFDSLRSRTFADQIKNLLGG